MSSFATAPSRTPDQESQNGKPQPQLLGTPDVAPDVEAHPRTQAQHVDTANAGNSQTLEEALRVERLLAQLEARSMALVPYGYGNLREVSPQRKSNTMLLGGVLVAMWLTTMILAVAYIKYVGHSPFSSPERETVASPMVITPDATPTTPKSADSVDRLAQALVSSSERMNELQAAVEKSNRDLQRIATRVNTDHAAEAAPTVAPVTTVANSPASTAILPKNWHKVLDIKPTDSAVAHKSADGTVDYWLVSRGAEAAPSKVLPIGTSADGVVIHNLEDGKDYTITPSGEWRNASPPPADN